ncbi:pyrimidine-specific ribonucleoside hydrolase RihA-like [Ischnura elegans]|uniref:pyrimidine-specific ribonucleoside hydrolase RihA-like n=1 Tax=Ischnura elegans TaxID=197161 RepID=UPI001ED89DCB|nr:pyrimidine-specific ribonucleoside hydrolase RihA-like [Ischnura elegans]
MMVAVSVIDGRSHSKSYKKELFILDVDAGSDDAVAIVMAGSKLARCKKRLEVVAITCVNGNTNLDNVVVNVLKTLKTMNRLDIPVYRGSPKSILRTPETDNFFGLDGFGDFDFEDTPDPTDFVQSEHAVKALIRLVNKNPGKINILAVGPLTNIALATRLDPNFMKNVKRIYVLGGATNGKCLPLLLKHIKCSNGYRGSTCMRLSTELCYYYFSFITGVGNVKPGVEFNFYMDPNAAEIVLSETARPICLVPWETVKIRSQIFIDWRKNVMGAVDTPVARLLNQAERIARQSDDSQWISADSYAAWMALNYDSNKKCRSTCGGKPLYGRVLTTCGEEAGALIVDYANTTGKAANFELIEEIDVEAFKKTLLKIVKED